MLIYEITYLITKVNHLNFIHKSVQIVNPLFARLFRAVYRKEPFSGFILVLGATDAFIGGLNGRGSLLSIGLLIALMGMVMRWRQGSKKSRNIAPQPVRYLLPPGSTRQPLPLLMSSKNHPRQ